MLLIRAPTLLIETKVLLRTYMIANPASMLDSGWALCSSAQFFAANLFLHIIDDSSGGVESLAANTRRYVAQLFDHLRLAFVAFVNLSP